MKRIAIFASGNGSNVQNIAEYFKDSDEIEISLVLTNNPNAGVLKRTATLGLSSLIFTKTDFYKSDKIVKILKSLNIDLIVLAGFLWLVPENLLKEFKNKIINIHPALLPKYGGKGMYGNRVHETVIKNKENTSGITIHYVNEKYDEGEKIFEAFVNINYGETPESLAEKIHKLEYIYYPEIIKKLLIDN
jgi:phosphoribosylglycinamide formyltransferase-1